MRGAGAAGVRCSRAGWWIGVECEHGPVRYHCAPPLRSGRLLGVGVSARLVASLFSLFLLGKVPCPVAGPFAGAKGC